VIWAGLLSVLLSTAEPAGAPPPATPAPAHQSWTVPLGHSALILAGMRVSLSLAWPDDFSFARPEENLLQLKRAYSSEPEFRRDRSLFESDGDPWILNVVGHGLFGSEIYLRMRQCGHRVPASFLTTAGASATWEYAVEAFHKRPSAFDLIWTPVFGALLGELRFGAHRLLRGDRSAPPPLGKAVLLIAIDPLGELERALGAGC
jgi:hypothetical protein